MRVTSAEVEGKALRSAQQQQQQPILTSLPRGPLKEHQVSSRCAEHQSPGYAATQPSRRCVWLSKRTWHQTWWGGTTSSQGQRQDHEGSLSSDSWMWSPIPPWASAWQHRSHCRVLQCRLRLATAVSLGRALRGARLEAAVTRSDPQTCYIQDSVQARAWLAVVCAVHRCSRASGLIG